MPQSPPPLGPLGPAFTHTCVTVGDMQAGLDWYGQVLGAQLLWGPTPFPDAEGLGRDICQDIFGPSWSGMQIAQTLLSNGIGLEIYHFDGPGEPSDWRYRRPGMLTHFGVYAADLPTAVQRAQQAGGKVTTQPWELFPGFTLQWVDDPWGNRIEFYNRNFVEFYANRGA